MSTPALSVYLGNGYGAGGTSGTWTGTITLLGVNAVPAPGAMALLGLAGLAGRRRRLLDYLKSTDVQRYADLIKRLNIRK